MNEELISKIIQVKELRGIGSSIITFLRDEGFRLIRLKKIVGKKNIIQFMVERDDLTAISVQDCAKLSKAISKRLDLADSIKEDNYYLEISSPGIERPLIELLDFKRFRGSLIKVKVQDYQAENSYLGVLLECNGKKLHILDNQTGKNFLFPFKSISEAQIVREDIISN